MATGSTASSDTDAPEPAESEGGDPTTSVVPARPASAEETHHDPARRAFFKQFSRQALTTVGQVAGMADIVGRTTSTAANTLLGLDEPRTRRTGTTFAPKARRTRMPAAGAVTAGSVDDTHRSPYRLEDGALVLLDQRTIPEGIEERVCKRGSDVAYHLRTGVCRGGPVMAQVAAYGMALTARERQDHAPASRDQELRRTRNTLANARPSSRLPLWAMERIDVVLAGFDEDASGEAIADALMAEADAIASRFQTDHANIASHLVANLPQPQDRPLRVLIHGDPGALSGGLFGTGITALAMLAEQERELAVFVTETRPFMEGARLAAYELRQLDIKHRVIADSAVAWLFARESIDAVFIGAEWIAADGATAGVIGSRAIALQAAATPAGPEGERPHIFVCGSSATVDATVVDGDAIPVEMRPSRDLLAYLDGVAVRATDSMVPATDVMPPDTIHALVTEQGLMSPVTPEGVAALADGPAPPAD